MIHIIPGSTKSRRGNSDCCHYVLPKLHSHLMLNLFLLTNQQSYLGSQHIPNCTNSLFQLEAKG